MFSPPQIEIQPSQATDITLHEVRQNVNLFSCHLTTPILPRPRKA
jgi:hypothetical protein